MTTLIDELLAGQQDLRPVERFAQSVGDTCAPAGSRFRELIPLSRPGDGEQYAFEVDLDRCTGCKACVAACHSLNGLEDEETWREVGTLIGGTALHPRTQTVTSACHHCAEPGCLEGCPVLAYEKDPETGIVRHLDDQCIGCSYCVLKCPYEVPKYSKSLGIVRKCDMCHSRLAVGEAPACVQACPTSAIAIRVVKVADSRAEAAKGIFLPDSPDPALTIPTTRYTSRKPLSERALAADHFRPEVQHTHWPLVFMLVLTQAGVGCAVGSLGSRPGAALLAAGLFMAGMAASILHLGQPLKAWRAFLGWRTSWLSREILAFGAVAPVIVAMGAAEAATLLPGIPPSIRSPALWVGYAATWLAIPLGVVAVACSAWVYHDTGRRVWKGPLSFGRFFLTAGITALIVAGQLNFAAAALAVKLICEAALVCRGLQVQRPLDDLDRAARLLRGPLIFWYLLRFGFGCLALLLLLPGSAGAPALAALLPGEILERALFFKAGIARKMPGH
jgi:Fe-S-cluster-containing dehydrogenase component/DMSO reductase anchor subunit